MTDLLLPPIPKGHEPVRIVFFTTAHATKPLRRRLIKDTKWRHLRDRARRTLKAHNALNLELLLVIYAPQPWHFY